ncbi:cyclic nucleotide-binding domain-containing protein, partial [Oscillochloris sp. ZM17-4]|uniref:cyclic nucleotide-binding domain-containing protein n=1 Tax=Oscillochloris sp. ZM17-4 TaxID=2866714 RepID=UPI001C735343|nr:cyclic nucleotide-binding domain-containing protein [Oscillochloris sp. ZM17-4]
MLLLIALSFCQGWALVMADTATLALFLSSLGAAALPGIYLAAAVVVPLAGASFGWLGQRVPAERLAVGAFLGLALLLLLLWGGVALGPWVLFLLLLWYRVFNALSGIVFWGLAGRLLNLRQSKRLYGLIGSGENVSRVLGYAMVPLIVGLLGVVSLLALALVGLIGALAAALALGMMVSRAQASQPAMAAQRPTSVGGIKALIASPYTSRILLLIALSTWAFSTLDLTFAGLAQGYFSDTKALASFLAGFSLLLSILRLLGRPLLTGPLIGRYGVGVALLAQPLALGAGALLLIGGAAAGGAALAFWMVVAIRLIDSAGNTILSRPSLQIFYQPLPATQRIVAQSFADGVVSPLALGMVGAVGLLLRDAGMLVLAPILLALALAWAIVARQVGRSYIHALGQSLSRRVGLGGAADLADPAALAQVRRALGSPYSGDVLYAIDLLSQRMPAAIAQARPALLAHADPAVRRATLGLISAGRLPADDGELAALLAVEPDLATRAAAIRALCAAAEAEAIETVTPYINDPSPEICRSTLVGLLRHGGIAGILAGGQRLLNLAGSPQMEDRILAATIMGDLGLVELFLPLRQLFADPAPPVRRAALLAAGKIGHARLVPFQIAALADRSTAAVAARSLELAGAVAAPALIAAFAESALAEQVQIATLLGQVGGEPAMAALRGAIGHPDADLRGAAVAGLAACGYRASGADRDLLRAQIRREAEHAAWLLAAGDDLGGAATDLLVEAIAAAAERCRERILHLLAISSDAPAIAAARTNLAQGTSDRRAYAIEIIDVLLPPDLKPAVLPLFDEIAPAERLRRLCAIFPQPSLSPEQRLAQLIDEDTPAGAWARSCALYRAGASLPASDPASADAAATLMIVGRVAALRKVQLFAATPSEILADIAERLVSLSLPAGAPIFAQGDVGDALFMLLSGEVRIYADGQTLNIMREGAVFGEIAILDPAPRLASAEVIAPSALLRLDRGDLDTIFD